MTNISVLLYHQIFRNNSRFVLGVYRTNIMIIQIIYAQDVIQVVYQMDVQVQLLKIVLIYAIQNAKHALLIVNVLNVLQIEIGKIIVKNVFLGILKIQI